MKPLMQFFTCIYRMLPSDSETIHYSQKHSPWFGLEDKEGEKTNVFPINFMSDPKNVDFFQVSSVCSKNLLSSFMLVLQGSTDIWRIQLANNRQDINAHLSVS